VCAVYISDVSDATPLLLCDTTSCHRPQQRGSLKAAFLLVYIKRWWDIILTTWFGSIVRSRVNAIAVSLALSYMIQMLFLFGTMNFSQINLSSQMFDMSNTSTNWLLVKCFFLKSRAFHPNKITNLAKTVQFINILQHT